eukprot:1646318-Rhodomonas_salina.2
MSECLLRQGTQSRHHKHRTSTRKAAASLVRRLVCVHTLTTRKTESTMLKTRAAIALASCSPVTASSEQARTWDCSEHWMQRGPAAVWTLFDAASRPHTTCVCIAKRAIDPDGKYRGEKVERRVQQRRAE